jgi:SAM-dependent methyltransferase
VTRSPDLDSLDALEVIAPFYDLDVEDYEDDVALYRELAAERRGLILELGCGTGRVALALAADGREVVGVDLSAAMLDYARARDTGGRVEWFESDMRDLDLGRRFALVLAPLGVLQHLETVDDVVATFEVIARHLAADGVAVIDVEAPRPEDFEPGPQPLLEHWTRPWHGGQVTKLVSVMGAPSLGLREVTWHFDEQPAEGPLRRHTARFTMRTFTPAELELAARLAGLEVSELHGDYDGAPYDDAAQRLVMTLVARSAR